MERQRLPYRADWDGLRGVAILLVLACHANLLFLGGFIGVDLFFALSGFLIARLILNDVNAGTFSYADFWERRLRRILPALTVVLLAVLAVGPHYLASDSYEALGRSALAVVGLGANFHFWADTGYFSEAAHFKPLLHTWSLANEEQFYLLCLLFLPWSIRRLGQAKTWWVVCALTVASFLTSVAMVRFCPEAAYFLLPSRFWEMGAGCLLAFAPEARLPRWARECLSGLGMATLILVAYAMDGQTPFPGIAAVPVILAGLALLWPTTPDARVSLTYRFLSAPPMVFLGKISYPLYLWHWPILVFLNLSSFDPPQTQARIAAVGLAFVLAVATYFLVEWPIRGRLILREAKPFLAVSALGTAFLLLTGWWVIDHSSSQPLRSLGSDIVQSTTQRLNQYLPSHAGGNEPYDNWPRFGDDAATPEFLLWGDSHAMSLLPGLEAKCKQHGTSIMAATRFLTPPIVGYESTQWDQFNEKVMAYLESRPVPMVILAGHWSNYLVDEEQDRKLLDTVDRLLEIGYRVHFVKDVPEFPYHVPRIMKMNASRKFATDRLALARSEYERVNAYQERILPALKKRGVGILDPIAHFQSPQNPNLLLPFDAQGVLYRDADHLSVHGSLALREIFEPVFQEWVALRRENPHWDRDQRGVVTTEPQ